MSSYLSSIKNFPQGEPEFSPILNEIREGVRSLEASTLNLLYLNQAAQRLYGRTLEEFARNSRLWLEVIHPDDLASFQNSLNQAIETGCGQVDYHLMQPSGEMCWVREKFWLIRSEKGTPLRIDSILTNLTEQRQTSDNLLILEREGTAATLSNSDSKSLNPKSEQSRFQKLVANIPGIIYQYILHPDGLDEFSYMSSGCQSIFELKPEEFQCNSHLMGTLIHPDDLAAFQQSFVASLSTLTTWKHEWRIITPSGKLKWLSSSSQPQKQPNGDIIWDGLILEISDRKQAEFATRQLANQLQESQRLAHIGTWEFDLATQIITWSEEMFRIFGWEPGPAAPSFEQLLQQFHPDYRENFQVTVAEAISLGKGYCVDFGILRLDGTLRYINARGEVAKNEQGQVVQLFGTVIDISGRKQAEFATQQLLRQLQDAQSIGHIGTWEFDATTQAIAWSEELFRIFGLDPSQPEPTFEELQLLLHPDDRALWLRVVQKALTTGQHDELDFRIIHSNGRIKYVNARGEAIQNEQGQVVRLLGTVIDITDRKSAEQALQEKEQFLRTIYDGTEQLIFVLDVVEGNELRYAGWNPAAERLTGLSSDSGLGKTPQEVFGVEVGVTLQQKYLECLATDASITYEQNWIWEGVEDWWLMTLNPLWNATEKGDRLLVTAHNITDRKRTEQALLQQEQFLRTIYDGVEQGIFVLDVAENGEFRYLGWNPAIEQALNITSAASYGKTPEEVFGPEIAAKLVAKFAHCVEVGTPISFEEHYYYAGEDCWWVTVLNPLRNETGRIYRIVGTPLQITQRKKIELALAEREQFLRSIYEGVDYSIFVVDVLPDGEFCFADLNRAALRSINLNSEQVLGKSLPELMPADMVHLWRQRYHSCVEAGVTISFEERYIDTEREMWWLTSITPLRDINNQIYRLVITASDISDRKQAELALQRSEAQFRALAQREELLNRLATLIRNSLDIDTILETTVWELRQLLGIDLCVFTWYRSQENPPVWEVFKEAKAPEIPSQLGRYATADVQPLMEKILNQEILQASDVSKVSDPRLCQSLMRLGYQSILGLPLQTNSNELGSLICIHFSKSRVWSDSEVELLCAVREQLAIALNQAELYTASCESARIATAKSFELEKTIRQLQQTQTQLIQSEKMSSLGQLVAGVAHEINNPVNFIYGNLVHATDYIADLLRLINIYQTCYPNPRAEVQEELEAIELDYLVKDLPKLIDSMKVGAERIREIVKSLRTFSRLDEADMKKVDLRENIDSTLMILQNRLKSKSDHPAIEVVRNYGQLPLVECYAGQLNQVFMNLLSNAIDAIDERNKNLNSEEIKTIPSIISIAIVAKGDWVQIRFFDNGIGMKKEVISRIFDPFYTTKSVGKGTGLGLSISYQIVVEKHKGRFSVSSEPGQGTEFVIEIPKQQLT